MDFEQELMKRVRAVNDAMEIFLPADEGRFGSLTEAMNYSVLAGGKRIRPVMMKECYELYGGKDDALINAFITAIELIHTSSLVHDDLPAIDNDLLRRGKETTHARYGEAVGVLAGDALLNYAYELLIRASLNSGDKLTALKAADIIASRSGYSGMLGGQAVDVEHEKTGIKGDKLEILNYIYEYKTAALFAASMTAGAALAGAADDQIKILNETALSTGIAFQIIDDILDVTGCEEVIGKPVFSDEKNQKDTYVSLAGTEAAAKRAKELTDNALMLLEQIPGDTEFLRQMIIYLLSRKK